MLNKQQFLNLLETTNLDYDVIVDRMKYELCGMN